MKKSTKLRKDKVVLNYTPEELQYLSTPIGRADYDYYDSDQSDHSYDTYSDDSSNASIIHNQQYYHDQEYYNSSSESYQSDDNHYEDEYYQDHSDEVQIISTNNIDFEEGLGETEESEDIPSNNKKAHWSDKITCNICGGKYTRSAVSSHRKTKKHQMYQNVNNKFLKLMIGDSDNN